MQTSISRWRDTCLWLYIWRTGGSCTRNLARTFSIHPDTKRSFILSTRISFARLYSRLAICAIWFVFAIAAAIPLEAAAATLNIHRGGLGSGTVTSVPAGISCGSYCYSSFPNRTSITLTATPTAGSSFSGWSGACVGTGMTVNVVLITKSTSCTANFTLASPPTQFSLTVTRTGTGSGTVNSAPVGISCGSICSYGYAQNTAVTLTATATVGSTFTGWSGSCTGTTTSTSIVVNANSTCVATFTATAPLQFSLTVTRTGTGSGTVNSAPAGISCGSVCSYSYTQNTAVTLTATATVDSTFTGWSGSCTGTTTSTSTVVNASSICLANFAANSTTQGAANLIWEPVLSAALSGYRVYYGTAPGAYQQPLGQGLDAGAATAFALSGLSRGIRYYFAVTAYDASQIESSYSNEAFKDIP